MKTMGSMITHMMDMIGLSESARASRRLLWHLWPNESLSRGTGSCVLGSTVLPLIILVLVQDCHILTDNFQSIRCMVCFEVGHTVRRHDIKELT